jgi:hypothetical protein
MADPAPTTTADDPSLWITKLYDFIHGVSGGAASDANKVADAADPYRSQRAQWQQPIVDLMKDPSSILQDPTFKASLDLGLEGVNRTAGAQGMSLSGNKLAALQQYGQTAGYNAIQTKLKNLMDLGGVTSGSPAGAAAAIQAGQKTKAQDFASGASALAPLIKSLFPQGVPEALKGLFKSMGLGQDASGNWTAVDANGNPDPEGLNPPGGVDVNPNPNAVDTNYNPDPAGTEAPGGVDVNPAFDPSNDPFSNDPFFDAGNIVNIDDPFSSVDVLYG